MTKHQNGINNSCGAEQHRELIGGVNGDSGGYHLSLIVDCRTHKNTAEN